MGFLAISEFHDVNLAYFKFWRVSFAVVRCQCSARDQSHGQAMRLWPGRRCWPVSRVGTTGGTAPYGVVRSDAVGGCGLVADFVMRLCTDVWRLIFDEGNVKECAPTLEDRTGM